jgi:hypothetical protein
MSHPLVQLQEATIKAQCKTLRMPMIASQFGTLREAQRDGAPCAQNASLCSRP